MQPEVPTGPRGTEIVLPSVAEAGNDARVATWRSLGRRLRGRIRTAALRMRRRWRSAVFRAARLAGASVAAFLAAEAFGLVDPPPLVAALTALLVVQATASSTLFSGVERVLSVVAGVALAIGLRLGRRPHLVEPRHPGRRVDHRRPAAAPRART